MRRFALAFAALLALSIVASAAAPPHKYVVVIAFENQGYSRVVNSPAMPYMNGLFSDGALATNYYANALSSLPDYFMLTTGSTITPYAWYQGSVDSENMARMINRVGKTWKVYAQGLPYTGYLGDESKYYPYVKYHVPFAYFTDVRNNSSQAARIVGIDQWLTDLGNGQLPNFSFIVPDNRHNAHDCPDGASTCDNYAKLSAADQFLQRYIGPLLSSPQFQQDGLLVLWWDEGSDGTNGGGRVAIGLVGPKVKKGYRSTSFYQHQSMLRTISEVLGLNSFPLASANAPSMQEFFTATTAPPPSSSGCVAAALGVTICSPANGATVNSPVAVNAAAKGGATITAMRAYLDGTTVGSSSSATLSASVPAASGSHRLTVNAWDSTGKLYQAFSTFTVGTSTAPPPSTCSAGANMTVNICAPAAGWTVASPAAIASAARWDGEVLTFTRAYVDGAAKCEAKSGALNCSVAIAPGSHTLTVVTWNSKGAYIKAPRSFAVK